MPSIPPWIGVVLRGQGSLPASPLSIPMVSSCGPLPGDRGLAPWLLSGLTLPAIRGRRGELGVGGLGWGVGVLGGGGRKRVEGPLLPLDRVRRERGS